MFRIRIALALALTMTIALPAATSGSPGLSRGDRATLQQWAVDTWRSMSAMVVPRSGLPADNIGGNLDARSRSAYTSPTNIGMYLWSTVAARDLGLISSGEATDRIAVTLDSVSRLERHEPSGQFFNWYDPRNGKLITKWPENGDPVYPFASSVDNGWLASALLLVANATPEVAPQASALAQSMNFGCYYDPNGNPDAGTGLIRGGFWLEGGAPPGSDGFPRGDYCGMGETVVYTGHHYGAFNTEPRIASYIGIALGQIPADHYFGGWRTFPDTCPWSWPETRPIGEWRDYVANGKTLHVFEGAYPYDDQLVVPTWGGSMFEALMVPLVVPEEQWGPHSWGVTHPLYVESQIEFGLDEAGYGYWGFSPSSDPAGGYREYGVDAIGMEPNGYTADVERRTLVDAGWDDPACYRAPTPIADYGQGVVTPHAAFLALDFDQRAAMANLRALQANFSGLYGAGGFKDAVNVATGQVADRYLALDQGMVMAAIANKLLRDGFQAYLATTLQASLEPLMAMEEFGAGRMRR
jgi:hypothetical protein